MGIRFGRALLNIMSWMFDSFLFSSCSYSRKCGIKPCAISNLEISRTPVHPKKADVIEAVIKAVIEAVIEAYESRPASLQADHKLILWRWHSLDARIGEGWSINLHDKLA